MIAHIIDAQGIQSEPTRLVIAVVTFGAIQVDEPADTLWVLCRLVRWMSQSLLASQANACDANKCK